MIRTIQLPLKLVAMVALLTGFATHATAQDSDGVTITLGGDGTSLDGTLSGAVTVSDGTTTVTGGTLTLDSSTYSGPATVTGGTLTLGSDAETGATVVTGGTLTLASGTTTGGGTLTVSGSNTYTGGATITGGSLTLGNSTTLSAGTLTLGSSSYTGATLTISGTNTFTPGGGAGLTLSGTLVVNDIGETPADIPNNITFGTDASVRMYFDSLNSTASLLDITGNVTLDDANLIVTDLAETPGPVADGTTFTLIHYTGTESGEFKINDIAIPDGGTFTLGDNAFEINYASGDPNMTITAVPEPSVAMMLASGLCLLAFWRRATRIKS